MHSCWLYANIAISMFDKQAQTGTYCAAEVHVVHVQIVQSQEQEAAELVEQVQELEQDRQHLQLVTEDLDLAEDRVSPWTLSFSRCMQLPCSGLSPDSRACALDPLLVLFAQLSVSCYISNAAYLSLLHRIKLHCRQNTAQMSSAPFLTCPGAKWDKHISAGGMCVMQLDAVVDRPFTRCTARAERVSRCP